jgi:hypothetical protein
VPNPSSTVFKKQIILMGLVLGAAFAAPVEAGWQKDEVCQGACGPGCGPCPTDDSSSASSYTPGINIAWGGMTQRATGMIKECNGAPGCILFRGVVLLPIGLAIDAPIYAVKGVAYGLYYGGKGIFYVGKGIGHGLAYPFNRPEKILPPAATWEQYKRDVLAYQKAVTKRHPENKENQKWCKGHIPLSMGPNRVTWESRCNPHGSVEHTAAVAMPAPVVEAAPAAAPAAAPVAAPAAVPVAAPAVTALPATPVVPAAPSAGAAATHVADFVAVVEAAAPPAAMIPPAAPGPALAVPAQAIAAATPALNSPAAALAGSDAQVKSAGQGGFDSNGGMLGNAGIVPQTPKGVPVTAKSAASDAPETPVAGTSASTTPGSRGMHMSPGKDVLPPTAPIAPGPLAPNGEETLIGNPDRYRDFFKRQTGETCAIVSMMQVLGDLKVASTEDALFQRAYQNGYIDASYVCNKPNPGDRCAVVYDPPTKQCKVVLSDGRSYPARASHCVWARKAGGTTANGIGKLLAEVSGKQVVNAYVPPIKAMIQTLGAARAGVQLALIEEKLLPQAREEVLQVLRRGRPVMVTVEANTLWKRPGRPAMHVILVTGAMVRRDGTLAGYYINDSGSGEYGKFVPRQDFERAWINDELQRVYLK